MALRLSKKGNETIRRRVLRATKRNCASASIVTNLLPSLPLVYVTDSRDNNVAQCIPVIKSSCPTVAISSLDKDPKGITGFLGSPGN